VRIGSVGFGLLILKILSCAPGGIFRGEVAAFEPAINGSKGRYAKPGYTTGAG
jgi:hypothetical protein